MQKFTDNTGYVWTINVNIGTAKRIKALLNIDMLETQSFLILLQDLITFCDILYAACKDEADKQGIDESEFVTRITGKVLRESHDAFCEAYFSFLPDPELTAKLRVTVIKQNVLREKALALIEKKMPRMTQQIDDEIDVIINNLESQIEKDLTSGGKPSTSTRASSASTRRRSHSRN